MRELSNRVIVSVATQRIYKIVLAVSAMLQIRGVLII